MFPRPTIAQARRIFRVTCHDPSVSEPRAPLGSVVIPAHDEERTIARCLTALHGSGDDSGSPFEVLVVANGCADGTAQAARSWGACVLELAEAGKAAALNQADARMTAFPRLYVDADVVLDHTSALALLRRLAASEEPLLAVPRRELHLAGAGWAVRAYYRTWQLLQEVRDDRIGSGVYGVNAAGRERWQQFPEGIADDYYVHSRFAPHERVVLPQAASVVRPPRTVRSLLAVRARIYAGNMERRAAGGAAAKGGRRPSRLRHDALALRGLPVYAVLTGIAKVMARRRRERGVTDWSQDVTGRAD